MKDEQVTSSERRMLRDHQVIGEAVALEIPAANVGIRIISAIIDYSIMALGLVASFFTFVVLMQDREVSTPETAITLSLLAFFWLLVVPVCVEFFGRGSSPGRLVTGCRVVRDDGGAVRLRHCVVRAMLAIVEVWLCAGALATIACAASRRGKRLGDHLAGTYVMSLRSGAMSAPPLLMPAELAAWAARADMSPLPGDLALAARTFLQRASTIEPRSRARIAQELAERLGAYVAPAAPPGTHPERFVAAVLCERRDRELAIARRDVSLEERQMQASATLPFGI